MTDREKMDIARALRAQHGDDRGDHLIAEIEKEIRQRLRPRTKRARGSENRRRAARGEEFLERDLAEARQWDPDRDEATIYQDAARMLISDVLHAVHQNGGGDPHYTLEWSLDTYNADVTEDG